MEMKRGRLWLISILLMNFSLLWAEVTSVDIDIAGGEKRIHRCGKKIPFILEIESDRSEKVEFRILFEDGRKGRKRVATTDGKGVTELSGRIRLDSDFDGWIAVEVLYPNHLLSSRKRLIVECGGTSRKSPRHRLVRSLYLRKIPSATGECPYETEVRGVIRSRRSGTVKYRFVRSDGYKSDIESIYLPKRGRHTVTHTMPVTNDIYGSVRLELLYPYKMVSSKKRFSARCKKVAKAVVRRIESNDNARAGENIDVRIKLTGISPKRQGVVRISLKGPMEKGDSPSSTVGVWKLSETGVERSGISTNVTVPVELKGGIYELCAKIVEISGGEGESGVCKRLFVMPSLETADSESTKKEVSIKKGNDGDHEREIRESTGAMLDMLFGAIKDFRSLNSVDPMEGDLGMASKLIDALPIPGSEETNVSSSPFTKSAVEKGDGKGESNLSDGNGTKSDDMDEDGLSDALENGLLKRFAPYYIFAKDERYIPSDALYQYEKAHILEGSVVDDIPTLLYPDDHYDTRERHSISESGLPEEMDLLKKGRFSFFALDLDRSRRNDPGNGRMDDFEYASNHGAGLYGHVVKEGKKIRIEYWQYFTYSSRNIDGFGSEGDWETITLWYDPATDSLSRSCHWVAGRGICFDLNGIGPVNGGKDTVVFRGANYDPHPPDLPMVGCEGDIYPAPYQNNSVEFFIGDGGFHPIVYIEKNDHAFWPFTYGGYPGVCEHDGGGVRYLPSPENGIFNLGEARQPTGGMNGPAALVMRYSGRWGARYDRYGEVVHGPLSRCQWRFPISEKDLASRFAPSCRY
jgi:hypothetical protein